LQSYEPYRKTLLPRAALMDLQRVRPWRVVADTLAGWLGIVAGFVLVALHPAWWTVALAIPLIGTRYYSLLIVGHDGLHRRLFASPRRSDLWNDAFILGPIGAITRLNRRNHIQHHATLATAADPDRYKYENANKLSRGRFLMVLTGLPYVVRAVANVFLARKAPKAALAAAPALPAEGYRARDLFILASWQLALIGGLSYFIGWWAYPVLWLLPVYCFAFLADLIRVFCEHSVMSPDAVADRTIRLVSFTSNAIERQFFAPHNMNCHVAHHLWPGIPYYNLPEAERRIREATASAETSLVWRGSYVAHLVAYWRWLGAPAVEAEEAAAQ
jgi:fatty acid desaturase